METTEGVTPPTDGGQGHLKKTLRWPDGVTLALPLTSAIFTTIGYTIGAIGAWAAITIFGLACLVALLQAFLYTEMALMFPNKPGGISVYAHEAWRRYFSPIGPLSTFGYWLSWSLAMSVLAIIAGGLIQAQWFPHATWTVNDGVVKLGLPQFIGIGLVVFVWLSNVLGVKIAVSVNNAINFALMACFALLIVVPLVRGQLHLAHMTWHVAGQWGGWRVAIVWFYLAAYTVYGNEIVATFAPEFKQPRRDIPRAIIVSALILLAVYVLVPITATATIGQAKVAANPIGYAVLAFHRGLGGGSDAIVAVVVLSLVANMISATADGGRALYGIARADMTIKQLDHVSKNGQPIRQMTLDLVVNVLIILLVGQALSILYASNLGYMVATFFAVSGFLLLRRDRPNWPRPFRLGRIWVPIAVLLCAVNLVATVVGLISPGTAGYGGVKEVLISLVILAVGPVCFVYRRVVQDKARVILREPTPALPEEDGDADLRAALQALDADQTPVSVP